MTTIATNAATTALKKLFDAQAQKAVELSGDEAGIKSLFPLLEQIDKVTEGEGWIPFVIVVQTPILTLATRMEKVVLNGKIGTSYLTDNRVDNLGDIPQGHYLAIDVEDGRAMWNIKPSMCLAQFKQTKRFGGTVFEGISVVTYEPKILQHHYIDLPGSRYGSVEVPCLCEDGGRPLLYAFWLRRADPCFGSLSCRRRLSLGV